MYPGRLFDDVADTLSAMPMGIVWLIEPMRAEDRALDASMSRTELPVTPFWTYPEDRSHLDPQLQLYQAIIDGDCRESNPSIPTVRETDPKVLKNRAESLHRDAASVPAQYPTLMENHGLATLPDVCKTQGAAVQVVHWNGPFLGPVVGQSEKQLHNSWTNNRNHLSGVVVSRDEFRSSTGSGDAPQVYVLGYNNEFPHSKINNRFQALLPAPFYGVSGINHPSFRGAASIWFPIKHLPGIRVFLTPYYHGPIGISNHGSDARKTPLSDVLLRMGTVVRFRITDVENKTETICQGVIMMTYVRLSSKEDFYKSLISDVTDQRGADEALTKRFNDGSIPTPVPLFCIWELHPSEGGSTDAQGSPFTNITSDVNNLHEAITVAQICSVIPINTEWETTAGPIRKLNQLKRSKPERNKSVSLNVKPIDVPTKESSLNRRLEECGAWHQVTDFYQRMVESETIRIEYVQSQTLSHCDDVVTDTMNFIDWQRKDATGCPDVKLSQQLRSAARAPEATSVLPRSLPTIGLPSRLIDTSPPAPPVPLTQPIAKDQTPTDHDTSGTRTASINPTMTKPGQKPKKTTSTASVRSSGTVAAAQSLANLDLNLALAPRKSSLGRAPSDSDKKQPEVPKKSSKKKAVGSEPTPGPKQGKKKPTKSSVATSSSNKTSTAHVGSVVTKDSVKEKVLDVLMHLTWHTAVESAAPLRAGWMAKNPKRKLNPDTDMNDFWAIIQKEDTQLGKYLTAKCQPPAADTPSTIAETAVKDFTDKKWRNNKRPNPNLIWYPTGICPTNSTMAATVSVATATVESQSTSTASVTGVNKGGRGSKRKAPSSQVIEEENTNVIVPTVTAQVATNQVNSDTPPLWMQKWMSESAASVSALAEQTKAQQAQLDAALAKLQPVTVAAAASTTLPSTPSLKQGDSAQEPSKKKGKMKHSSQPEIIHTTTVATPTSKVIKESSESEQSDDEEDAIDVTDGNIINVGGCAYRRIDSASSLHLQTREALRSKKLTNRSGLGLPTSRRDRYAVPLSQGTLNDCDMMVPVYNQPLQQHQYLQGSFRAIPTTTMHVHPGPVNVTPIQTPSMQQHSASVSRPVNRIPGEIMVALAHCQQYFNQPGATQRFPFDQYP